MLGWHKKNRNKRGCHLVKYLLCGFNTHGYILHHIPASFSYKLAIIHLLQCISCVTALKYSRVNYSTAEVPGV